LRSPSGILGQYTVPTAAQKSGDFTQSGFTVYDPSTAHADPANPGRTIRNPFAGNVIPASRFDIGGAGLLKYYPDPNYTSPTAGVLTNYLIRLPTQQTQNSYHIKGDANISANDIVSGHFSQPRSLLAQKGWLPDDRLSSHTNENGNNVGLRYSHVFNPGLLNEARVSYNRFVLPAVLDNTENVVDQFNIPGWHTNPSGNGFPTVSIATLSSSAPIREIPAFGPPFALIENTYQYLDTITWQKGSHSIKFGAEYDHLREDRVQARSGGGIFTFNGTYTTQVIGQTVAAPRNGVGDMLLGLASSLTTQYGFDAIRMGTYRASAFLQDDWRVTSKLTLNLGVRYDLYPPYHEQQDRFANFDLATGTRLVPESARRVVQNTLGLSNGDLPAGWKYVPVDQVVPGTNFANFAPRIGVAYAPGHNLSFRAGYGLFYSPTSNNTFNNSGTEGNPFFFDFGLTGDVQTPISLRNGFPTGGIVNVLASPSFSAYYGPLDRPDPYSEKYSANIEWSPRTNMVLDVGYMGQRAFHFRHWSPVTRRPYPLLLRLSRAFPIQTWVTSISTCP
jgi:outer membrane receptor protein involved in Fe transport